MRMSYFHQRLFAPVSALSGKLPEAGGPERWSGSPASSHDPS